MSESKRTTIGRYKILGRLGKGSMAAVFKAYDPKFQREVAIKVLRNRYANDSYIIKRFHREARAIAKLEHPAIVSIYDAGRDENFVYIVMQYMPGGTLADKITQGGRSGMSIEEIAAVINRVGSALDVAHSNGIIHRDVKPANVLYDQYGQPFLADFGIAKLADSTGTLTVDNFIGTPAYMSPEQVNSDKELDGRSDIYSLGTILYEMLSGEMPYQADTTMRLAMMHVMSPVPSIVDVAPKQKKWQSVIKKAMAKKPEKRYQTGREFSDAVMKTGRAQTTASVQNQSRAYIYAALGAVGLIALASILSFFLLNRSQQAEQDAFNAQATEFAQIEATQQTERTVQAEAAAAFEATSTAFAIEADKANRERELLIEQTVLEMAAVAVNEDVCTEQNEYDFEVRPMTFEPPLGSMYTEEEGASYDIQVQWIINNNGCPARNVRLVSSNNGDEFIPVFTNSTGDAQGNAILENESAQMSLNFDSIEEANEIDDVLTFVVEDPDGRDLQLNNIPPLEMRVPDDEQWLIVMSPEPLPTQIVVAETDTPTDEPDNNGPLQVAAVPRNTDTPRPRPTNTRIPTRTPNYNATQTRRAEEQKVVADGTERAVNATRTVQAQEASNSQTRTANSRNATANAFQRGATATAEAQQATNGLRATETKRAQENQANLYGTRQAQTRQAEQNARNFQATQTQQTVNQQATLTRQAQIGARIATQTRQAQIQKATANAFNVNATRTRQAQINHAQATQNARNVRATQTRQTQIRNATATANARPVQTQPTTPPQSTAVTPRITDTSCVQAGNGFVNGTFRWTGQLGANQWYAIRIAPQGQAPQQTGTYVKNNITSEGKSGNNWALTSFDTSLAPGDYSWTVALLDSGNPIAFAPQTGCFSNAGVNNNNDSGKTATQTPVRDPRCQVEDCSISD